MKEEIDMKRTLIVASFGTSYPETAEKNIVTVEKCLADSFPEHDFFRAYTSGMIRRKLLKRDNLDIDSVESVLEKIKAAGYTDLLLQPTHIIPGTEFHDVKKILEEQRPQFSSIKLGDALLASEKDFQPFVDALKEKLLPLHGETKAIVLMGHGSRNQTADQIYEDLEKVFHQNGFDHLWIGTVEGGRTLADLLPRIQEKEIKEITLLPLMLVAGDHAQNDMAGEEEDSWASQLRHAGYQVESLLEGLGEIPAIREMYLEHAKNAKEI